MALKLNAQAGNYGAVIKRLEGVKGDLARLHKRKANQVVKVAEELWRQRVPGNLRGFRGGRGEVVSRYTGRMFGPLRRAVQAGSDETGWGFPDLEVLDELVRSWRRVEFGDGGGRAATGMVPVDRAGRLAPRRGPNTTLVPYYYYLYEIRGGPFQSLTKRDRERVRAYFIPRGTSLAPIEGNQVLTDAFVQVASTMEGEYQKYFNGLFDELNYKFR